MKRKRKPKKTTKSVFDRIRVLRSKIARNNKAKSKDARAALFQALRQRNQEEIESSFANIKALDAMDPLVAAAAMETFESARGALNWLTSPEISLSGKAPISVARTAKGAARVTTLLKQIDYNVAM